jgi:hypothetical protein
MQPAVRLVSALSLAPARVPAADDTTPYGVYEGEVGEVDLARFARLAGWTRLRRRLAEKRWRFVGVFGPDVFVAAAIVRAGYAGSCFAYAFERGQRVLTARERIVPPGPLCAVDGLVKGGVARFHGLGLRATIARSFEGIMRLSLRARGLRADVVVEQPMSPLVLVSPVPLGGKSGGTGVNVTHKAAGLPVTGVVEIRGRRFDLGGSHAVIDDTHGLLARDTSWRWAAAAGRGDGGGPVWGLNLVAGFNDVGATENAVWRDGQLHPVGRATFGFDPERIEGPWQIRTDDGAVDVVFTPEGMRKGDVRLGLVRSHYRAPLGAFSGKLLGEPISGVPGITEDHTARW